MGKDCKNHGSSLCLACNKYYKLADLTRCESNKCFCLNGTPAANCDIDNQSNCLKCNDGYDLMSEISNDLPGFNTNSCRKKECTCKRGKFAEGIDCPSHGQLKCTDCENGYHLENEKCVKNKCVCSNGNPATGTECPYHGEPKCVSCNSYYTLIENGAMCIDFHCSCPHGKPAVNQCSYDSQPKCESCNPGFDLVPEGQISRCRERMCFCPEGTAARGTMCPKHGEYLCTECQPGYHKENEICVKNKCTCPNGTPATGIYCETHGASKCSDCHRFYKLAEQNTRCVAHVCSCPNGTPAKNKCTTDNQPKCQKCNSGYDKIFLSKGSQESSCQGGKTVLFFRERYF